MGTPSPAVDGTPIVRPARWASAIPNAVALATGARAVRSQIGVGRCELVAFEAMGSFAIMDRVAPRAQRDDIQMMCRTIPAMVMIFVPASRAGFPDVTAIGARKGIRMRATSVRYLNIDPLPRLLLVAITRRMRSGTRSPGKGIYPGSHHQSPRPRATMISVTKQAERPRTNEAMCSINSAPLETDNRSALRRRARGACRARADGWESRHH